MSVLYYRHPIDGNFYPIIGSDVTGKADKDYVDGLVAQLDAGKVDLNGDTMSGDLIISQPTDPLVILRGSGVHDVQGRDGSDRYRWILRLGDNSPEDGGDVGSDLAIYCYNDNGDYVGRALRGKRSDGRLSVIGSPSEANGIATKNYVDTEVGPPTSWTAEVRQGGSALTLGSQYRRAYSRIGNVVTFEYAGSINDTGASGGIYFKYPVNPQTASGSGWSIGQGAIDIPGSGHYPFFVYRQPGDLNYCYFYNVAVGVSPSFPAIAPGTVLRFSASYLVT